MDVANHIGPDVALYGLNGRSTSRSLLACILVMACWLCQATHTRRHLLRSPARVSLDVCPFQVHVLAPELEVQDCTGMTSALQAASEPRSTTSTYSGSCYRE
ncbi:hypothetical protein C8Q70DRAFT_288663 [Cubamyces menziesii]|nr:hypothetical protein C8Q70DRAFT_288663 [Cubamyces menziesii]